MTVLKNPSHPGEVLAELYLGPLGMSAIAHSRDACMCRARASSGW